MPIHSSKAVNRRKRSCEIETGEYDLVAMATHGHNFFGDILFGSVSDSLKHKINVPLLLLKYDG